MKCANMISLAAVIKDSRVSFVKCANMISLAAVLRDSRV